MSSVNEQEIEDGVFEDVEPPCVALVPVAPGVYTGGEICRGPPRRELRHPADRHRRAGAADPQLAARCAGGRAVGLQHARIPSTRPAGARVR